MKLFRKKAKDPDFIALSTNKTGYELIFNQQKNTVEINKKEFNISVEKGTDGFEYVVYQNKRYPFEIIDRSDNKYSILINGVAYNFSVETPTSFERKKLLDKHRPVSKSEIFRAPMPGKIIDILVDEGTEINEGDALLVLEAMKMQNEILSHVKGVVKKIHIQPGMNVAKDDILIEIEKDWK